MSRDDTPDVVAPAESEIQIEKIDTEEKETSPAVSVEDDQLVLHPEEQRVARIEQDPGYVTTRIPPIAVPQSEPQEIPGVQVSSMRYGEDLFLQQALDYIKGTYGEHYANPEAQGFQLFDLWDSQGSLLTTARDTAQKYLTRFGKKKGFNKKDLFKAIHYIILMNYANRNNQ